MSRIQLALNVDDVEAATAFYSKLFGVEPAGRSQGTVSVHLSKLVASGLAVSEKRGRNVWYSINPAALEALRAVLATR